MSRYEQEWASMSRYIWAGMSRYKQVNMSRYGQVWAGTYKQVWAGMRRYEQVHMSRYEQVSEGKRCLLNESCQMRLMLLYSYICMRLRSINFYNASQNPLLEISEYIFAKFEGNFALYIRQKYWQTTIVGTVQIFYILERILRLKGTVSRD